MTAKSCGNCFSSKTEFGQLFSLGEVASAVGAHCRENWVDSSIEKVNTDTRSNCGGALFVALRGEKFDAHDFICEAFAKGVTAAIVSEIRSNWNPEWKLLKVSDTLTALSQLAAYRRNCLKIPVI
ncbi:MAG: Mur ligase domain-containing protein, partial [Planctomycetota bacterium]